jgi:FtsZ-binding cell division protein ZapB
MATKFVPFETGTLNDQNLKNVDFVRGKFNEAVQAVTVRDTEIERLATTNVSLQKQFTDADALATTRATEIEKLRKEVATQAGRAQDLSDKLAQLQTAIPKIGVQDLVNHFKTNIDSINADVVSQKTSGMLIDSVEVEVRGGIDVSDGLHITQLPASALGVASVSVLKFNLRPTSALKIVDDDTQNR